MMHGLVEIDAAAARAALRQYLTARLRLVRAALREAARIDRIMLLGHAAFGLGTGVAARRFPPAPRTAS